VELSKDGDNYVSVGRISTARSGAPSLPLATLTLRSKPTLNRFLQPRHHLRLISAEGLHIKILRTKSPVINSYRFPVERIQNAGLKELFVKNGGKGRQTVVHSSIQLPVSACVATLSCRIITIIMYCDMYIHWYASTR
jgi:hypothetical protein